VSYRFIYNNIKFTVNNQIDLQVHNPKTKTKNLYSQINHTLQWYREVTYKNTTQHIHDK
jgi:hypothetical protein